MKRAIWITCGPRNNAGDALLYEVTERLFAGLIDLRLRCVNDAKYLRLRDASVENVIIGPGGLLVQTNSSRHLHAKLDKQWSHFRRKSFHLWSTGILSAPSEQEIAGVLRIMERSRQVVVRATKEREYIQRIAGVNAEWAPCASLFSDKLLEIEDRTRDVVVVNFDEFLFTADNISDHPLRRFRDFANAQGLDVRSMVNAGGDSNRLMLDLFPLIDIDRPLLENFLSGDPSGAEFNIGFNAALAQHPSLGERYIDCRFAFGKRLHGWLPFMSFNKPAAFIGMPARRGMTDDYFGTRDFTCAVPRQRNMSREQLDRMADMMIEKLAFFIKREDSLKSAISARRTELWDQLRAQAVEFSGNFQ